MRGDGRVAKNNPQAAHHGSHTYVRAGSARDTVAGDPEIPSERYPGEIPSLVRDTLGSSRDILFASPGKIRTDFPMLASRLSFLRARSCRDPFGLHTHPPTHVPCSHFRGGGLSAGRRTHTLAGSGPFACITRTSCGAESVRTNCHHTSTTATHISEKLCLPQLCYVCRCSPHRKPPDQAERSII